MAAYDPDAYRRKDRIKLFAALVAAGSLVAGFFVVQNLHNDAVHRNQGISYCEQASTEEVWTFGVSPNAALIADALDNPEGSATIANLGPRPELGTDEDEAWMRSVLAYLEANEVQTYQHVCAEANDNFWLSLRQQPTSRGSAQQFCRNAPAHVIDECYDIYWTEVVPGR